MFFLILHQPRALLTLPSLYAVISKHLIASFHEGRGRRRKKEERGLEGKKEEKREERENPFQSAHRFYGCSFDIPQTSHLPERRRPRNHRTPSKFPPPTLYTKMSSPSVPGDTSVRDSLFTQVHSLHASCTSPQACNSWT